MNSIPLVEQLNDLRNLLTFSSFTIIVLLILRFIRENPFDIFFAIS